MSPRSTNVVLCSTSSQAHTGVLLLFSVAVLISMLWPTLSNGAPTINSISAISDVFNPITDQSLQTIDIAGSGFGTMSPYTGNSSDILFADCTNLKFSAGFVGTNPGVCGIPPGGGVDDVYGLIVNSWSDTQIILGGIDYNDASSVFGTLANEDTVEVLVFNPQTGAGPGEITCTVGGGACTASAVPAPSIGHGLPVLLAVGGILFGAKLLEWSKKRPAEA